MKVVWSETAKRNFQRIVDYLFEEWTEKEIDRFNEDVSNLIVRMKENVNICPEYKVSNLRKCLIDKNNSLIYLYENELIYIVTLIGNRSFHNY